ncbi:MAG: adenine deaminase [candidate division WOR-3 bacterium]
MDNLLLKNGRLVNIFTGEIVKTNILVSSGKIREIGPYLSGEEEIDLKGSYLLPGLIESHIHLESSLLSPNEFSRLTLLSGTTTLICDPHEISNVLGIKGIYYLLKATRNLSQDFYFLIPSCVPATKFETAGGKIGLKEMRRLLKEKRILGLAEVMNFPGVISGDKEILGKIRLVQKSGRELVIDGHSPGLRGKDLAIYLFSGISSDHESVNAEEAKEKLSLGMWIMVREGSAAKNLKDLLPIINWRNERRLLLCSDDIHPEDLLKEGHLNAILRKGVSLGIDPILLLRMATLNPATYFPLRNIGAIAPGYRADMTIVKDLKDFRVLMVIKNGAVVVKDGEIATSLRGYELPNKSTFRVKGLSLERFLVKDERKVIKVIKVLPGQIITKKELVVPKVKEGEVISDTERDILKLVVIERHKGTGNIGIGFVSGFGLKEGAIGSSVAHDSHNIIVVGVKDEEIFSAAKRIIEMRGGMVVLGRGKIKELALPIAGLLSDKKAEEVISSLEEMGDWARKLGCQLVNPFATLSFLALPVIPELKLTDKGLFDVEKFQFVPIFGD